MSDLIIREAVRSDIPAIVGMLADDPLGATRETPNDLVPYEEAFAEIESTDVMTLLVAEQNGEVVGTAQLSFLPGLSHRGMWRAEIEAVRIREDKRGSGLGSQVIQACIAAAEGHGCGLIQLSSNVIRTDARRFYERLGFAASHVGLKMRLPREFAADETPLETS